MASLASLLEDWRNWKGRQEWEQGKGWQDFFGGDPRAQEQFEKLSGFGTDAGGLVGMIKASHGSPHAFDKFDFSKIGTGEGAQAYGHGGYFAQGFDSPVAQEYRDKLSTKVYMGGKRLDSIPSDSPQAQAHHSVVTAMSGQKIEPQEAISNAIKYWNDAADEMLAFEKTNPELKDRIIQEANSRRAIAKEAERLKPEDFYRDPGHLYNVELKWPDAARESSDPLGEHHLLDWDAPLSEQHPSVLSAIKSAGVNVLPEPKSSMIKDLGIRQIVRSALKQDTPENVGLMVDNDYQLYQQAMNLAKKLGVDIDESSMGDFVTEQASNYLKALSNYRGQTGESVYRSLMENPTSMVEATQKLNKVGIPGIRYLDQASRGAGEGTRNYVMFDDAIPEIVTRNGQPKGLAGMVR